jgi:uncharacterized repeat protein (TIGR01451 family)
VVYLKESLIFLILVLLPSVAFADNNSTVADNITLPIPQANASGILKIITIPVDGAIYLDNQLIGSGLYYNASFPVGVYLISFGKVDGYDSPENQTVSISAGNQTNVIAQYTAFVISPPDVTITKEVSSSSIAADETVGIIIKIKNNGNIKAFNVNLNDSLPDCAVLVKGKMSWSGDLESGESRILDYEVNPTKAGLCIFNPSRVTYADSMGNKFSKFSDELKVLVSSKPIHEPHLTIEKNVDKSTAQVDEGAVITLKVKNDGSSEAINVSLTDPVPSCAAISQGRNNWSGDMQPDEQKVFTYIVNLNLPGLCSFDAAKASYKDVNNNNYTRYSEPLNIYVKEKTVGETLDTYARPLVIIGTLIGSLVTIITVYRSLRNKVHTEKKNR